MDATTAARFGKFLLFEHLSAEGRRETRRARAAIRGHGVRLTRLEIGPSELSYFFPVFVEELSRAGFLFHRGIHQVLEFGQIEGTPFYTAEDHDGVDLRTLLVECRQKRVPLPIPCALFVAREIAGALAYAHARRWSSGEILGVLHGALVPQKIFITAEGEAKVSGFGSFRALDRVALLRRFIDEASIEFLAPETVSRSVSDARTDVYGCGSLLYAMLTFRSPRETALQHGRPSPPSSLRARVSPAIDALCRLTLAESVADRSLDAAELERELGRILAAEAPGFVPTDLAAFLRSVRDGSAQRALDEKRRVRLLNDPRREGAGAENPTAARVPMPWTPEGAGLPLHASVGPPPSPLGGAVALGRMVESPPQAPSPPPATEVLLSALPNEKRTLRLIVATIVIAAVATAGILIWWFVTDEGAATPQGGGAGVAERPSPRASAPKGWPGVKPVALPGTKEALRAKPPPRPARAAIQVSGTDEPAVATPPPAPAPKVAPAARDVDPDPFPETPTPEAAPQPVAPRTPKPRPSVWPTGAPGHDDALAPD